MEGDASRPSTIRAGPARLRDPNKVAADQKNDKPTIERYLDALWMEKGLSENTLASYRRDLVQFDDWLSAEFSISLLQSSKSSIEAYLGWRLRQGLSARSTAR